MRTRVTGYGIGKTAVCKDIFERFDFSLGFFFREAEGRNLPGHFLRARVQLDCIFSTHRDDEDEMLYTT
jgi:hypothetical protein